MRPKIVHISDARNRPEVVYCGRPSPYGNPFSHKEGTLARFLVASKAEAVDRFEEWLQTQPDLIQKIKSELPGKTLSCWCAAGTPCHVRVIFKIANGYLPEEDSPEKNLFDD